MPSNTQRQGRSVVRLGLRARARATYAHFFLDHPDGPGGAWVSLISLLLLAVAVVHIVVRCL